MSVAEWTRDEVASVLRSMGHWNTLDVRPTRGGYTIEMTRRVFGRITGERYYVREAAAREYAAREWARQGGRLAMLADCRNGQHRCTRTGVTVQ